MSEQKNNTNNSNSKASDDSNNFDGRDPGIADTNEKSHNTERKETKGKNLKATWSSALLTFFAPFVIAFAFRWILFEPYVIPSGSMIPTLLVHDHILVNKWVYGWRFPFSEKWLHFWKRPVIGEIVVFKYPLSKDTYFIKRVVAVEGDEISVIQGQLIINGKAVDRSPLTETDLEKLQIKTNEDLDANYDYFSEQVGDKKIVSRSLPNGYQPNYGPFKVPTGHFFVVGDNRDESSDSRSWGVVPFENLMGRAWLIWLACSDTLPSSPMLCDPSSIRWNRIFKKI